MNLVSEADEDLLEKSAASLELTAVKPSTVGAEALLWKGSSITIGGCRLISFGSLALVFTDLQDPYGGVSCAER